MQPPSPSVLLSFVVAEEHHRLRLDRFLQHASPGLGRKRIERLLRMGVVRVDGVARDRRHFVKTGEKVEVAIEAGAEPVGPPSPPILLVRTPHLLAVGKPPNLPTNPVREGEPSVLSRLEEQDAAGEFPAPAAPAAPPRPFPPGIVHRLDRDTSGLLLLSLTPEAHRLLTQAFRDRSIRKRYLALVAGRIRPRQGTIDRPLARVPSGRMRVTASGSGMRAVTRYRTLASTAEASLLEVEPQTGRTHQIRVHLASIGHPVAGDPLYGEARTALGAPRLWLHASRIELPPALALALEAPAAIDCPLWEDLRAHLASLGIRSPLADGTGSSPPDGPAGGSPGQDARNT